MRQQRLPVDGGRGGSGASERVVFCSPASGKLCPPSNIPNTATEYFVPALGAKENKLTSVESGKSYLRAFRL